jgi:phosphoglycolate phosphatase
MQYRLVIFDLDGTLSDSFPWFSSIINSIADKHHFRRVEEDQVEILRASGARQIMKRLGIAAWRVPAIARDMRRLKSDHLKSVRLESDHLPTIALFPGVDRLLREMNARGTVMAIVSSDSEENTRRALGPDNAALIAHYACGSSLFGKSRKFRQVLKRTGIAPSRTICIGDEIRDIEAARKVGLDFGAVSWGYTAAAALQAHAPEQMFSNIDDLIAKLTGSTANTRMGDGSIQLRP